VTGVRSTTEQRDDALRSLLDAPHTLIAALSDDGFRIPVPTSLALSPERVIPMPADRATMIDLLLPDEAMKVILAWEQALASGIGFTKVHPRYEVDRLLTLSLIDMRHRHGVWVAVLSPAQLVSESRFTSDLAGALPTSLRPRTATMVKSEHAVILDIDDRASRMLGWMPVQMIGKRSTEFLHPDDHARSVTAWLELLAKRGSQRVRTRYRCADGTWLWVETEHTYVAAAANNDQPTVTAQLSDISDEMKAHEDVGRSERLFRRLAESLPLGLLQLDVQRSPLYANNRLAEMIGSGARPSLSGLVATVETESRAPFFAALDAALRSGHDRELEIRVTQAGTHDIRTISVNIISLGPGEGVPGALCCFSDITEGARLREELRAKATFDVLTGCHNRATVMAFLTDRLAADRMVAALFVDLDDFKPINDEYGHEAGDELLVCVAHRLMDIAAGRGMVGRLGGDEFLLVATDLTSEAETLALAERIGVALRAPVPLAAATVALSASVGVACSTPGEDGKSLVKRADAAMYLAKSRRKPHRRSTDEIVPPPLNPSSAARGRRR
jgi:diguanylate cyclase (GGDEF)-like protein/PAS domain S-box-containing protein